MDGRLLALQEHGVVTLHDRSVPGSRTTIDHIAVGPAGVFVIDVATSSRTAGSSGGREAPRCGQELRCVGIPHRTETVAAVRAGVALVHGVLDPAGRSPVTVRGILVASGISSRPLRDRPQGPGDVRICTPPMLVRAVGSRGPLTSDDVRDLAAVLRDALPPGVRERTG